ncbi:hypothetical protein RDABS01_004246 [Bienertia sinuspersici]
MNMSLTGMSIPSIASLFSVYASLSAFITLLQQAFDQFIPERVRDYIIEKIEKWFSISKSDPCLFKLVIEESDDSEGYHCLNQVFEACDKYLSTKLSNTANCLKVSRQRAEDTLNFRLAQGEQFKETFQGKELVWSYVISSNENSRQQDEKRHFELVIEEKHKELLKSYLNYVLSFFDEMMESKKDLNLHTLSMYMDWHSVEFKHPFTFDSLAMDPGLKKSIIDDLDRFVKRKEFYKRVGKAWKRGYLLYGPPGTGKSSLIAAMANYLKFDIYDLQLDRVDSDSNLKQLMLNTNNKSILVVEDIDCCFGLPSSREGDEPQTTSKISLSGLLNFVDGLWSSCGDERIIIFTTNHKEKLDPALLRAGRMDVHIHMSYLTMPAFRILASNYLQMNLHDEHEHEHEHPLFGEIERLLQTVNVTAAEVSEEMLRSDDTEVVLRGVVHLLKGKKCDNKETKEKQLTLSLSDKDMNLQVGKEENLIKF